MHGFQPDSLTQGITMHAASSPATLRRSSRVPVAVPLLVTSLEPNSDFSEVCETLMVSAHGCAMESTNRLDIGAPVHFQTKQGRHTQAHIVDCQPLNHGRHGWKLAASLDEPENFFGLEGVPEDWRRWISVPVSTDQPFRPSPSTSDAHLRSLITETVAPLQAEIANLKQQLAQAPAKRSNFEISLTHIPPEVEEKLWQRLREDLGAQTLQQTKEQAERVLESAHQSIEETIGTAQGEFRQYLRQELQTVEQRAHGLSEEITDSLHQHLNSRVERFHQHVLEAGIHLERRSNDFLGTLQQRLGEDHETYRREIHQAQTDAATESSRLQSQLSDLGSRFRSLDESAFRLESGMDAHLTRVSNDIISGARSQLEGAVDLVLKELGTRNAKEIGTQLDEACGKLQSTRKSIEASLTELLKTEIASTLLSFGQTMEELAQDSVGRWRSALARDLNSVAKTLGGQFKAD